MSLQVRGLRSRCRRMVRCFLIGAIADLAFLSCDDSGPPTEPCPPSTIGFLQGTVRIAGQPVAIGIGARMVEYPGTIVAQTRSDENGQYRLALPPGVYRLELDPQSGVGFTGGDTRDVVRVEGGAYNVDVLRGTLVASVAIPAALDGTRFTCILDPPQPLGFSTATAVVQDGRVEFEFPIVQPRDYRLRLATDGPLRFWLPGTGDPRAADVVTVGTTDVTVYRATVRNYAVISGSITGSWQETNTSTPSVAAYTLAQRQIGQARSAADGSFTLTVFDAQPVRLRVSITGIDQWIGGDTFETATTFDSRPGRHIEGVSVVEGGILCQLEGPGLLDGHRAQLVLRDESGRDEVLDTVTDNPIPICNLWSGLYRLYVHGDCDSDGEPWAPEWYDDAESPEAATSIQVVAGRATRITMHLDPDGRIEGRVLDRAGLPTPAHLAVYRAGSPLCDAPRYLGMDPFSIRGLANADYQLAAVLGDALWWYPGTASADSAAILTIRDHGTLSGIEWRLPALDAKRAP